MTNNTITITVSGTTGSGKTTIAELITRLLSEQNFDVTHDLGTDGPRAGDSEQKQLLREHIVKEKCAILVNERHLLRRQK